MYSLFENWDTTPFRYDLGKVLEAEAAFAEGIQLDISNQEMLRWRALSRDRIEELRVEQMKKRRFSTDYSKFAGVLAEAEIPDDEENGSARVTARDGVSTRGSDFGFYRRAFESGRDWCLGREVYDRECSGEPT